MTAFYQALKRGKSKAQALQSAMLDLKSRYPHCYQWAPFILMGKG
jgi:CHAT domain-containing protein